MSSKAPPIASCDASVKSVTCVEVIEMSCSVNDKVSPWALTCTVTVFDAVPFVVAVIGVILSFFPNSEALVSTGIFATLFFSAVV